MRILLFLAIAAGASAEERFFADYKFEKNNRAIFRKVIDDLASRYGTKVETAYGDEFCTRGNTIVIDEGAFDSAYFGRVKGIEVYKEVFEPREGGLDRFAKRQWEGFEAIGSFVIAHEYFHLVLKHEEHRNGAEELRAVLELQADYLAARYLKERGLLTSNNTFAVYRFMYLDYASEIAEEEILVKQREFEGVVQNTKYPHEDIRGLAIDLARSPLFYHALFRNRYIDNSKLLDWDIFDPKGVTNVLIALLRGENPRCEKILFRINRDPGHDPLLLLHRISAHQNRAYKKVMDEPFGNLSLE